MRKNQSESQADAIGTIVWGVIKGVFMFFLLCVLSVTYVSELALKLVNKTLMWMLNLEL